MANKQTVDDDDGIRVNTRHDINPQRDDEDESWMMQHFVMQTTATTISVQGKEGVQVPLDPPCMQCKYCLAAVDSKHDPLVLLPATVEMAVYHLRECPHVPKRDYYTTPINKDDSVATILTNQAPFWRVGRPTGDTNTLAGQTSNSTHHAGVTKWDDPYDRVQPVDAFPLQDHQQQHQQEQPACGASEESLSPEWKQSLAISRQLAATASSGSIDNMGLLQYDSSYTTTTATTNKLVTHPQTAILMDNIVSKKRRRLSQQSDNGGKDTITIRRENMSPHDHNVATVPPPSDQPQHDPNDEAFANDNQSIYHYVQDLTRQVQALQQSHQRQQETNRCLMYHLQICNQWHQDLLGWMQQQQREHGQQSHSNRYLKEHDAHKHNVRGSGHVHGHSKTLSE